MRMLLAYKCQAKVASRKATSQKPMPGSHASCPINLRAFDAKISKKEHRQADLNNS